MAERGRTFKDELSSAPKKNAKEFAAWRARVLRSGGAAAAVFEQLAAAGHDIPVTEKEWQRVGKKYGTSSEGGRNWDRDKHHVKAVRKQLMEQTESLPLSSVALEEGEPLLEYLYRQSKVNSTYWVEKSKVGGGVPFSKEVNPAAGGGGASPDVDSLPVSAKSGKAPANKKQPFGNGKTPATENDDFKSFEDVTTDYLEQWKQHSTVPARNGKGRVLAQTTMHLVQLAMVLTNIGPGKMAVLCSIFAAILLPMALPQSVTAAGFNPSKGLPSSLSLCAPPAFGLTLCYCCCYCWVDRPVARG